MSIRFDGLGINLGYVPKTIQLLGFEVSILGLLLTVSMVIAVLFVVLDAKRKNQDQDMFLGAILVAALGAVIGGRIFYVAFSWNLFKSNLFSILAIRNGGMAYYGAVFGGILMVWLYSSIRKVSFGELADTLVLGTLIVQMFTRMGDFFNRESFGVYTDALIAMQLPLSSVRPTEVLSSIRENLLTIDGASWIQVHPVFAYDILWCLILFLVFLMIRKKKRFSGEIFMRYMAGYGFGRFFIEWLRTDQLWIPTTTLPINMILAASCFVIFSLAIRVSGSMAKKRNEAASRRKKELEEAKAAEEAAAAKEAAEPVDIQAILREEERLQEQERMEAEKALAEKKALEEMEQTLAEIEAGKAARSEKTSTEEESSMAREETETKKDINEVSEETETNTVSEKTETNAVPEEYSEMEQKISALEVPEEHQIKENDENPVE